MNVCTFLYLHFYMEMHLATGLDACIHSGILFSNWPNHLIFFFTSLGWIAPFRLQYSRSRKWNIGLAWLEDGVQRTHKIKKNKTKKQKNKFRFSCLLSSSLNNFFIHKLKHGCDVVGCWYTIRLSKLRFSRVHSCVYGRVYVAM